MSSRSRNRRSRSRRDRYSRRSQRSVPAPHPSKSCASRSSSLLRTSRSFRGRPWKYAGFCSRSTSSCRGSLAAGRPAFSHEARWACSSTRRYREDRTRGHCRLLPSSTFQFLPSLLERAHAVGASVVCRTSGAIDGLEDRRAHVTPAGNEGREASGMSTHDEEVDVVGRGYDRDAAVGVPLQPLRKVAVVHLAVTVIARDCLEGIARVHPKIVADVRTGPTRLGDCLRMLET